jgi:adenylylsulfate kinase
MNKGLVFWFTGLSGAGKTTLAQTTREALEAQGRSVMLLDGDGLRPILSANLGFGRTDVIENNTRVARHCAQHRTKADIVLVPIISPYVEGRAAARSILTPGFFLIHVRADIETVIGRDPKGLYRRALAGEISDMIGYSPETPYEPPGDADLTVDTVALAPRSATQRLVAFISERLAA